jgi:hypothetical protein
MVVAWIVQIVTPNVAPLLNASTENRMLEKPLPAAAPGGVHPGLPEYDETCFNLTITKAM